MDDPGSGKSVRVVGTLSCQRDSYLNTLDAEVISCTPLSKQNDSREGLKSKNKNKKSNGSKDPCDLEPLKPTWLIECTDSVLFPEGGGQPSDHGTLTPLPSNGNNSIQIDFVERQGLHCLIHSPTPLALGTLIRQEVDFTRRMDHMQQHTGQHLLSAIMKTYDGLRTVGWGMGAPGEMSYVDLARKPTDAETREVEERVNEVIRQNVGITVHTPDDASTTKLPDDYDSSQGVVRVIRIGDLDNNTCCGTHLKQTGHISLLLLGSCASASGNRHRQYFIAGKRAINLASTSISTIRSVAQTLSTEASPPEVLAGITRQYETVATLKKSQAKLISEIAEYEIQRVKRLLGDGQDAFVYRTEPGMDFIHIIAAGIKDEVKDGRVVMLLSGEKGTAGAVVVIGTKEGVEDMVKRIKDVVPDIKGGGKKERWQGKINELKGNNVERLKELIEGKVEG